MKYPEYKPQVCARDVFRSHAPRDYTYFKSEEEKRKDCEEIVAISKYYKEQCKIIVCGGNGAGKSTVGKWQVEFDEPDDADIVEY